MISMSFIIFILSALSVAYAIPYANYEFRQKNKAGAIMIYIIATACIITSVIRLY